MDANDLLALGLGIAPPWRLVGQRLDTDKRSDELHIELAAERGALFTSTWITRLGGQSMRRKFRSYRSSLVGVPRLGLPLIILTSVGIPSPRAADMIASAIRKAPQSLGHNQPLIIQSIRRIRVKT